MNEMVDDARGFAALWNRIAPKHLGTNFSVDPAMMRATICRVITASIDDLEKPVAAARKWFFENELQFESLAFAHVSMVE